MTYLQHNIINSILFTLFFTFISTSYNYAQQVKTTIEVVPSAFYSITTKINGKGYFVELRSVSENFNSSIAVSEFDSNIYYSFIPNAYKKHTNKSL